MPNVWGQGRRGRPAEARRKVEQLLAELPDDAVSTVSVRALAREAGVAIGTAAAALSRRRQVDPAEGASPAPISFPERSDNLNNKRPERSQEESHDKVAATRVPPTASDRCVTDEDVRILDAACDIIDAVAAGVDGAHLAQQGTFLEEVTARGIRPYGPCATFIVSLSNRSADLQQRYRDLLGRHDGVVASAFHRPYREPANTHLHVLCSSTAVGELRPAMRGGGVVAAYDPAGYLDYLYPSLGTIDAWNGNEGGLTWGRRMPASAVAAWMTMRLDVYHHRQREFKAGTVLAIQAVRGNIHRDWLGEDWQGRPNGLSTPSWRLRIDALALLAATHRLETLGASPSPTFPRDMVNTMKMPLDRPDGIALNYIAARTIILEILADRAKTVRDPQTFSAPAPMGAAGKMCPPVREEVAANG